MEKTTTPEREIRQIRSTARELKTREEEGQGRHIEGYFAVVETETELWPGVYEEIASGAFAKTLGNDIRALINHDTTLVLGRNKSGTLELREDSHGLWGRVAINEGDTEAVNVYERVKRGDVDQCSFGFNIVAEEVDWNYKGNGSVKFRIMEIDLHEVSVCTFPAYEDTSIQARHNEVDQYRARMLEQRKQRGKERLKECLNN